MDLGLLEHLAGPTGIAAERSGSLSSARQQAKGDESGCDKGLHGQFPHYIFQMRSATIAERREVGDGRRKG